MKVETKYVCEICGAVYSDKNDCEACERGCLAKLKIIYGTSYNSSTMLPQYITVWCEETNQYAIYKKNSLTH